MSEPGQTDEQTMEAGEPPRQRIGRRVVVFGIVGLLLAAGLLAEAAGYKNSAQHDRTQAEARRLTAQLHLDRAVKGHDAQAEATETAQRRATLAVPTRTAAIKAAAKDLRAARTGRALAGSILTQAKDEAARAAQQEDELLNGDISAYNAGIAEYNSLYTDVTGKYFSAISKLAASINALAP